MPRSSHQSLAVVVSTGWLNVVDTFLVRSLLGNDTLVLQALRNAGEFCRTTRTQMTSAIRRHRPLTQFQPSSTVGPSEDDKIC